MALLTGLPAAGGDLLGACWGTSGVALHASVLPQGDHSGAWELMWTTVGAAPEEQRSAGARVSALPHSDIIPATAAFSWRQLDDGALRIWMTTGTWAFEPENEGPEGSGVLRLERLREGSVGCVGAGRLLPRAPTLGTEAVLIITRAGAAWTVSADGRVRTVSLPAGNGEPTPSGKRRGRLARSEGVLRIPRDERGRLERVDVQMDAVSKKTVGAAWRIMMEPSGAVGQLSSAGFAISTGREPAAVLHRIQGGLLVAGTRVQVEGALLEPAL